VSGLGVALRQALEAAVPGAVVVGQRPLEGGVSAQVTEVLLRRADGSVDRSVLRRPPVDGAAEMEERLLRAVHGVGLPVPRVRPWSGPAGVLWMDFVEGDGALPEPLEVALDAIAGFMVALHGLDPNALDLPPLPARHDPLPELRSWCPADDDLQALLDRCPLSPGPTRLLHGDVWPGNLRWRGAELVGVLDWEDAALGDPVSDVAATRQEVQWQCGEAAAQHFLRAYEARERAAGRVPGMERLPWWQLYVAVAADTFMDAWGLPAGRTATMRHHARALAAQARGHLDRQRGPTSGP